MSKIIRRAKGVGRRFAETRLDGPDRRDPHQRTRRKRFLKTDAIDAYCAFLEEHLAELDGLVASADAVIARARRKVGVLCPHCTASGAWPGKTLCALCDKCEGAGVVEASPLPPGAGLGPDEGARAGRGGGVMFSVRQKREIADAVQAILRATNHPELPAGEIQFQLHVEGAASWSWADIRNNGAVENPWVNEHNEAQDPRGKDR